MPLPRLSRIYIATQAAAARHTHKKGSIQKRWNLRCPGTFPFICACTRIPFLYYFICTWCKGDSQENMGRFSEIYNWHPTMLCCFWECDSSFWWHQAHVDLRRGASCEQHFFPESLGHVGATACVFQSFPKGIFLLLHSGSIHKNGMGKSNKEREREGEKTHQKAPQ